VTTIVIYIVAILLFLLAFKSEKKDLYCYDANGFTSECGPGQGMSYIQGRPDPNDDVFTLLNKLEHTVRHDDGSVKWRRCLIFALIATFVLFFLLYGRLPNGVELLISFIVIYIGSYLMYSFFQSNLTFYAVEQADETIDLIRAKLQGSV
jgi:hypothetical protein